MDYYRILQVDRFAEPEVIESAYKRLAKKYHPDVAACQSSMKKMQQINEAYEVLGNSEKRRLYDLKMSVRQNSPPLRRAANAKSVNDAKAAMEGYFEGIRKGRFLDSYKFLSEVDRGNISEDDFVYWQGTVSKVFRLSEYRLKNFLTEEDREINGHIFRRVIKFAVSVSEYNIIMDMEEKNYFTKLAVLEETGSWRVYLGYHDLQPLISKFNSLAGLLAAKSALRELVEEHSKKDPVTGFFNKKGILEKAESEALRSSRYGNEFSLIWAKVEVDCSGRKVMEAADKKAGAIFATSLRSFDVVGRWSEGKFLIILPETSNAAATQAIKRLDNLINGRMFLYDGRVCKLSVEFKLANYDDLPGHALPGL